MRRQKKIPTILGLLFLIASLGVGIFLVNQRQIFKLGASPDIEPKNVRITNISDNGFTISWTTDKAVLGFVSYGEGNTDSVANDDQGKNQKNVHHATISNLDPNTNYRFKISSGSVTYDQNGNPWTQRTARELPAKTADLVTGIVKGANGLPAGGVVVYVTLPTASALSAVTDANGQYSLSLASARTTDLASFARYDKSTIVSLFVQGGRGIVASAQTTAGNINPVGEMTMGQTHDFRKTTGGRDSTSPSSNLSLPQTTSSPTPQGSSFDLQPLANPTAAPTGKLTIDNPKEGEKISTSKPQFRGTAGAGSIITVTLQPGSISDKITVPKNGIWTWTSPNTLSGSQKITATMKDSTGKTQTVVRNFTVTVALSGSGPSFTASESAALASPTASPKTSVSPSPSAKASARAFVPSTESGVPVSGDLTITLALFILGIGALFSGLVLFRASSKS